MNLHLTTKIQDTQMRRRRQRVAGWGLALLAAVAVGSWQVTAHRDGTSTADVKHRPVSPASVTRPVATTVSDSETPLTIFIVGSADEATRLQETIEAGDQILHQFGKPSFNAQVVVAASAEEEATLLQAEADVSAIRAGMGLPPITVINTRPR